MIQALDSWNTCRVRDDQRHPSFSLDVDAHKAVSYMQIRRAVLYVAPFTLANSWPRDTAVRDYMCLDQPVAASYAADTLTFHRGQTGVRELCSCDAPGWPVRR